MKFEIDTTHKTIKVEDAVSLQELTDTLEKLMPDGAWKEFTLCPNSIFLQSPGHIIIKESIPAAWPWTTPNYPTVTY